MCTYAPPDHQTTVYLPLTRFAIHKRYPAFWRFGMSSGLTEMLRVYVGTDMGDGIE